MTFLIAYRILRDSDLLNKQSPHSKNTRFFHDWIASGINPYDIISTIEMFIERCKDSGEVIKISSWGYFNDWILEGSRIKERISLYINNII